MAKDMPIAEARQELTSLPERLRETHETVTVTRRGKPVLTIMPWEDYDALIETLEILSDPELMATLRQSIRELKAGKTIPWAEAKKKLGL